MAERRIRVPMRSEGVPKETPGRNSLGELEAHLETALPGDDWVGLQVSIEDAGYFAAPMQEQFSVIVRECLRRAHSAEQLIAALSSATIDRIRGAAPVVVQHAFGSDLPVLLNWVKYTAQLDGTWPREMSTGILHRQFIERGVGVVLPEVESWTREPHEGARRVVTEAVRPRLMMVPHIISLKQNPTPLRGLLGPLLEDPSKYVRTSVANCLNDVSRDNPEILIDWVREWWTDSLSEDGVWVLNRALRTLVAASHPEALKVAGYGDPAATTTEWHTDLGAEIQANELFTVRVTVRNDSPLAARYIVQLKIEEPAKGRVRRSTYKIGTAAVDAGASREFRKVVHFTHKTRQQKLPGGYRAVVDVNGTAVGEFQFRFDG